jgi:hypothetical protein
MIFGSWICSLELEDSVMDSNKREGSAPLPTVKSKSTRGKYSSIGWKKGNWILPPSIPTLPDWMEDRSGDTLTSSAEDSPARISALPGNKQESTESVPVFGENTPDSFARFDPDTSSWRTSQTSLFSGWIEYSETWPQAGTMRNGVVFQRQRWVPPIEEIASGSSGNWPTPTIAGNYNRKGASPNSGDGLETAVKKDNWPIPRAIEYKNPGMSIERRQKGMAPEHLSEAVRMWPTPTSRDHKDTGDSIMNGTVPVNGLLGRAVAPTKMKGSLDPAFVEYLMGYPIGWTVLKPLEIR